MPTFTLRYANRSQSNQDWIISNGHSFQLLPNWVQAVRLTVNNDYTLQIAVNTQNTFAAATLKYTANNNLWALNSNTPNEFQLAQGNGIVTVRCFLNATADVPEVTYDAMDPKHEPEDPD